MSLGIKVEGFLKDVGGADRVTELRRENRKAASAVPDPNDPIRKLADALHPGEMKCRLLSVTNASPTAKTFRFVPADGHVPVFQSGQYVNFRLQIGNSTLTRPYSLSSAPYEARTENPFFEITVRRNRPYLVPDYLFDQVKVGDVLDAALPFGTFYYEPLRDSSHLLALAGGSGIAPFHSLAKEIAYGQLKGTGTTLTVLYGSMKSDDIVLKADLDAIERDCPDVKIVHVLSNEPDWPGEQGFLTKEVIEKYMPGPDAKGRDATVLFCGPYLMYKVIRPALDELGVPKRRIRCDVLNNPKDVTTLEGYPKGHETETYSITVVRGVQEDCIPASGGEPVAVALERAGIKTDTHCRNGECGFCRAQLISGEVFVSPLNDGRRLMDKEMGWFHPCSSWPLGNLKIKIPIL